MKCFVILVALAMPAVISSVDTMKNIGYLGAGYDIFYGNPHSHQHGVDPGFRYSPILFKYTTNRFTSDQRYKIPDHTLVRKITACQFSFNTEIVSGASSYKKSLQTSVSGEGSYYGASFSASVDYKRVQEGSKSSGHIYTESTANCDVYQARLEQFVKYSMSESFKNAISQLNGCTKDDKKYQHIIDTFGTHYTTEIHMGGMFGQRTQFTRSAYQTMMDRGVDVKLSASYSGMATSGSAHASVDVFNANSKEFREQSSHQEIFSVGSHPPTSGKALDWVSNVVVEPMPTKYTLRELYTLLDPINFPDDKDIYCKSAHLMAATLGYCEKLRKSGKLVACSEPGSDAALPTAIPKIIVKAVNSFRQIWSDKGSGGRHDVTASIANAPQGYAIMGSIAEGRYGLPSRNLYVVKTSSPSELIRNATKYNRIWTDRKTGSNADGEVYRPVCPNGFNSISDFPAGARNVNPKDIYVAYPCIANKCLVQCFPQFVWNDKRTGGSQDITWWTYRGVSGEGGGLGYFRANNGYGRPSNVIFPCLNQDCLRVVT